MAMRRGHHTTRVLKALGTSTNKPSPSAQEDHHNLTDDEILPTEFDED
jgi:acetolactate synthase-1/3 small subunit